MRAARGRTVVHEVSHSSGLEHAKRKVETSGPALIVVVLEQTVNTAQWHFNYAKTDVKIPSAYSPMLCTEIKCLRTRKIKLYTITLGLHTCNLTHTLL